jgi:hypothetical protein
MLVKPNSTTGSGVIFETSHDGGYRVQGYVHYTSVIGGSCIGGPILAQA